MSRPKITGWSRPVGLALAAPAVAVAAWVSSMPYTTTFGVLLLFIAAQLTYRAVRLRRAGPVRITIGRPVVAIVLAAGVLAVTADRIWTRHWWPGVGQADKLPDACTAIPAAQRDALTRLVLRQRQGRRRRGRGSSETTLPAFYRIQ